jgi:hypothetical protein
MMGEAKRRKLEISTLRSENARLRELSGSDRVIADCAIQTFEKLVLGLDMVNGCYNLAFFLSEYLSRKHHIHAERVFGWVTDEENISQGMAHAWIRFNGHITDISLFNNECPDVLRPGAVIIQGIAYRAGRTTYKYHLELPPENRAIRDNYAEASVEAATVLRGHEEEFERLKAMSKRSDGAIEYFATAEPELSYEKFRRVIEAV